MRKNYTDRGNFFSVPSLRISSASLPLGKFP